jgi:hypothetical protein
MPKKPIKHGLKVFALCCAYTGYLYCYEVYTGKENTDGSPKAVIERLMLMAGVTFVVRGKGRVLYTDNFYTSMEVMQHVFERFGVLMVGTFALTKNKSGTAATFPFHRLSKSCMDKTAHRLMRGAKKCIYKGSKLLYKVQATLQGTSNCLEGYHKEEEHIKLSQEVSCMFRSTTSREPTFASPRSRQAMSQDQLRLHQLPSACVWHTLGSISSW